MKWLLGNQVSVVVFYSLMSYSLQRLRPYFGVHIYQVYIKSSFSRRYKKDSGSVQVATCLPTSLISNILQPHWSFPCRPTNITHCCGTRAVQLLIPNIKIIVIHLHLIRTTGLFRSKLSVGLRDEDHFKVQKVIGLQDQDYSNK